MELHEYTQYDAVGLAGLVARGEVTVAELTAAARAATAAVNPRINAVVESWPAEDAPAPGSTPLAGVPFLIKDLAVSMRGKRVELGSRLAAGNVAGQDSFLMRRLRRAGLVTLGRTATPEFAYSTTTEPVLYGATRNPWDLTRTPGGSSGGSAAAVAAGITPSRTPPTRPDRSGCRPPVPGCSASSPPAAASPWDRTPTRSSTAWPCTAGSAGPCATVRPSWT